jgi:DNA-binding NarL/FixJ family response regulator
MTGFAEVDALTTPSTRPARPGSVARTVLNQPFVEPFTESAHVRQPTQRPTATVLVCDRLRAVADSLAEYLNSAPGLAVPGVATAAAQLLALLDADRSDLVVLDSTVRYQDSTMAGEGLVAVVRRRHPATRVLMIGPTGDPGAVAQALREGALGWLTVDSSAAELAEAAYGVLRGEYKIAPELLAAALGVPFGLDASAAGKTGATGRADGGNRVAGGTLTQVEQRRAGVGSRVGGDHAAGRASVLLARLSERERLVLSCLVGGMHRRDIAAKLGIAETTARTHISRILSKLDAHSMIEAAALGRRAGLSAIEP